MKTKIATLLILLFSSNLYANNESLLIEYFSYLAKETTFVEKKEHIKSIGKPIIYKLLNKQGESFYTVTSKLPKFGCFSVVISHNKRKMNFLSWEGRWYCDNVKEQIAHYKLFNNKKFRPADLL